MTNRSDLFERLRGLEIELHRLETRWNPRRLEELLHPDFVEFGRSGRRYGRREVLAEFSDPAAALEPVHVDGLELAEIAPGAVLVTYRSAHETVTGERYRHTLRSSLWVETGNGWRMRFHQGTPVDEASSAQRGNCRDAATLHGSAARERKSMYILYHSPYSQHARRVVSLMAEANLKYELRHVDMGKGEHRSVEYLAINPNHQVPTLIDGDTRIHESNAILRYLCVKHGLSEWYPEELAARAGVEQWLDWNQCRLSPAVIDIVLNKVFLGKAGDQAAIARGLSTLPELWSILDAGLADTPFLAGSRPTIADLSLASSVFQLTFAGIEPAGRNIVDWFSRVRALEGFRKSLPPAA